MYNRKQKLFTICVGVLNSKIRSFCYYFYLFASIFYLKLFLFDVAYYDYDQYRAYKYYRRCYIYCLSHAIMQNTLLVFITFKLIYMFSHDDVNIDLKQIFYSLILSVKWTMLSLTCSQQQAEVNYKVLINFIIDTFFFFISFQIFMMLIL